MNSTEEAHPADRRPTLSPHRQSSISLDTRFLCIVANIMATPPGPPPTMTTAPATVADVDAAPGPTIPPSYVATENGFMCLFCGKTWPKKIGITYHLVRPPSCTLRSHKRSSADVFALPALHAPNAAPPPITIVHVLEVSPPLVAHMQSHARLIPSATLCAPQSSRVDVSDAHASGKGAPGILDKDTHNY